MILASRPLRFLALVVGGWAGARAFVLWPLAQIVPTLVHAVAPPAVAEGAASDFARSAPPFPRAIAPDRPLAKVRHAPPSSPTPDRPTAVAVAPITAPAVTLAVGEARAPVAAAWSVAGVDPPPSFAVSRWSASAWAILRPDGRATPFASQLGGSQAGARVAYAVDGGRRVAVYARASTAVDAPQREAAVGIDWRPTHLPIHLIAERRIGIEGVPGGTAVGAVGGVGPTRVAGPVRVEGYAQAGVIFRERREGFADGSLRVTVPATTRLDLGLGAWGGAQREAARIDVGPTVGVTIPVARHMLRLSADWRQRVVGDARPGSGPAASLGVDF